jgi:hypothetical protein
MDKLTNKAAIDFAWHRLERLHGVRLILAREAERCDPRNLAISRTHVIPMEEGPALGKLAQLLFDADPSGAPGNEAFEMVRAAAADAGHAVDFGSPVQNMITHEWWLNGQRVPAPEAK